MWVFDSTLAGAGGGAVTGGLIGGPWGALIGGGLGGLGGLISGAGQSKAAATQKKTMEDAMRRLQALSAQQYQGRMQDLDKTMAFYGPAERYLQSIYGGGAPAPTAAPSPMASKGGAGAAMAGLMRAGGR